jgi:hypothetical protein
MARKKTYGRTIKGELITEDFIAQAVERAETGYDVDEILKRDAEAKAAALGAHAQNAPPRRPRRRR